MWNGIKHLFEMHSWSNKQLELRNEISVIKYFIMEA